MPADLWTAFLPTLFSTFIMLLIIFHAPLSVEKENKKRAAKGKPALTEEEYIVKIKKERVLACVILFIGIAVSAGIYISLYAGLS